MNGNIGEPGPKGAPVTYILNIVCAYQSFLVNQGLSGDKGYKGESGTKGENGQPGPRGLPGPEGAEGNLVYLKEKYWTSCDYHL